MPNQSVLSARKPATTPAGPLLSSTRAVPSARGRRPWGRRRPAGCCPPGRCPLLPLRRWSPLLPPSVEALLSGVARRRSGPTGAVSGAGRLRWSQWAFGPCAGRGRRACPVVWPRGGRHRRGRCPGCAVVDRQSSGLDRPQRPHLTAPASGMASHMPSRPQKRVSRPTMKPKSPMRLTMKAFMPALALAWSLYQKPISR